MAKHVTVKGAEVSYVHLSSKGEANKDNTVLLLHGMSFDIKNWEDIGTVTKLASWGLNVVAVGLHAYSGYGKVTSKVANALFIAELVDKLGLVRPVIVAPSASGALALPYIFELGASTAGDRMSAFVAIAPVAATSYAAEQYKSLKIPVLNLHGGKDRAASVIVELMQNVPDITDHVFPGAGHACYIEKPEEWHDVLKKFLTEKVKWSITESDKSEGSR